MSLILPENFPNPLGNEPLPETADDAPLIRVAVLNIMPDKVRTEADILRALPSDTYNIKVDFIALETHVPSAKSAAHIKNHYIPFSKIRKNRYDALIVTGAPLEMYEYQQVSYFDEFLSIAEWAQNGGARQRMYICWAAFALVYARYGIDKHLLDSKLSGVYRHSLAMPHPVMRNFPEEFKVPHSRNIYVNIREILGQPELCPLATSDRAGVHAIYDSVHDDFLVFGHWEYAPDTLDMEFRRDSDRGLNPAIPENYFVNNIPGNGYTADWITPGKIFFRNFIGLAEDEK